MTHIDESGFHRTRLNQRLTQLEEAMRHIFGPHIDLDPDSADGQTLGIFADHINQCDQLAELVYQSFNPQTACGHALSRLVALGGLERKQGTFAYVSLTLSGLPETLIPKGVLVSKENGENLFATLADIVLNADGKAEARAQSLEKGPCVAAVGTLTKIGTPVYGWHSVTNNVAASGGQYEETDEDLRIRWRTATAIPALGCSTYDVLLSALLSLPDVTQVQLYDKESLGVHVVIEGGDPDRIAQTIWNKKSLGVTLLGKEVHNATDSLGKVHTVHFSRPTIQPLFIQVTLRRMPGAPLDIHNTIALAIVNWGQSQRRIGGKIIVSQLYIPVNSVGYCSIVAIKIGLKGDTLATQDIHLPDEAIAQFSTNDIQIILEE